MNVVAVSLDIVRLVDGKLGQALFIIIVVEAETSITTTLDPFGSNVAAEVDFILELGVLSADLGNGLVCGHVGSVEPSGHFLGIFL